MDQLLSERDTVNRELRRIIDEPTEGPWGVRVERVEIKDVSLPESMKRSMVAAGRGGTGAPRQDHHRRRRIPGLQAPRRGRQRHGPRPRRTAAKAAADRGRGRRRKEQHAGHAGTVELLRFFDKLTPPAPAGDKKSAADTASLADFGNEDVAKEEAENRERSAAADTRGSRRSPTLPVQMGNGKPAAAAVARHNDDVGGLGRIGSAPLI